MRLRSRWRDQRGQAFVEIALIMVVMVPMILGIINFAFIMKSSTDVMTAASAGAAYAAQSSSNMGNLAGIQTVTAASNGNSWRCAGTPTVSSSSVSDAYGEYSVTVSVRCNVAGMLPMVGLPTAYPVSRSAVRQVQP